MLSSRREVVPLDGHQRDEAADPVCRSRGVDAGGRDTPDLLVANRE